MGCDVMDLTGREDPSDAAKWAPVDAAIVLTGLNGIAALMTACNLEDRGLPYLVIGGQILDTDPVLTPPFGLADLRRAIADSWPAAMVERLDLLRMGTICDEDHVFGA